MPRIANSGPKVSRWHDNAHGEGSSTFDLCVPCFRKYDGKHLPTKLQPYHANEPRGIVEEMDSIDPNDAEADGYRCNVCNTQLTPRNY